MANRPTKSMPAAGLMAICVTAATGADGKGRNPPAIYRASDQVKCYRQQQARRRHEGDDQQPGRWIAHHLGGLGCHKRKTVKDL